MSSLEEEEEEVWEVMMGSVCRLTLRRRHDGSVAEVESNVECVGIFGRGSGTTKAKVEMVGVRIGMEKVAVKLCKCWSRPDEQTDAMECARDRGADLALQACHTSGGPMEMQKLADIFGCPIRIFIVGQWNVAYSRCICLNIKPRLFKFDSFYEHFAI